MTWNLWLCTAGLCWEVESFDKEGLCFCGSNVYHRILFASTGALPTAVKGVAMTFVYRNTAECWSPICMVKCESAKSSELVWWKIRKRVAKWELQKSGAFFGIKKPKSRPSFVLPSDYWGSINPNAGTLTTNGCAYQVEAESKGTLGHYSTASRSTGREELTTFLRQKNCVNLFTCRHCRTSVMQGMRRTGLSSTR